MNRKQKDKATKDINTLIPYIALNVSIVALIVSIVRFIILLKYGH